MVGCVVVVGTLTRCLLRCSVCDLKASLMNELMLYDFKLSDNTMEATKTVCCTKGEGEIDLS